MILLTNEPLVTAHTIGSSRSAVAPVTWLAFNAKSSPTTPTVFLAATLVITETSSNNEAISSNKVNKELKAIFFPCVKNNQNKRVLWDDAEHPSTGILGRKVRWVFVEFLSCEYLLRSVGN